ncbi:putative nuclease HARBI1 [Onthophagus taurus]|uniref:putative nuclease HARBI1 n=1 Tax=Onthophagus taurus TaxID=166361 RepID=UPI0039BDC5FC
MVSHTLCAILCKPQLYVLRSYGNMPSDEAACLAIIIAITSEDVGIKKRRRKRRVWMKEWLKKRSLFSHANLLKELQLSSPLDYKNYLRMDPTTFGELLVMITPLIEKQHTIMREAISPKQRLFATLRYLTSGLTYEGLKFETAIAAQTLGKIIIETCDAIIKVLKKYIKLPQSENEWRAVSKDFETKWNFPLCLGAIDGKHIHIFKLPGTGSYYFNYKHSFSIVLMGIVNANYEFLIVDVGANGRVSDAGVFSNTFFYKKLVEKNLGLPEPENLPLTNTKVPCVFVGDDAFPLLENLMKPFSKRNLTKEEKIYNYRVSRSRRIIENAFGILASRFRILLSQINLCPEKAVTITVACCYLHNFLRHKNVECYFQGGIDVENINTGEFTNADWRADPTLQTLQPLQGRNSTTTAKEVIAQFCNYFNTVGAVPWQDNIIS